MSGKIILSLAVSLDGYIASDDGSFDWIVGDGDNTLNTKETHDFPKFLEGIDIVVMGGDCYRQGFAKDYPSKIVYIATTQEETNRDNLRFVKDDIVSLLQKEKEKGKNVFLFGGGKTIDPFIKANAIDQYDVAIIPTILGSGRKLFLENNPQIPLHLDRYTVTDGTIVMTYSKR